MQRTEQVEWLGPVRPVSLSVVGGGGASSLMWMYCSRVDPLIDRDCLVLGSKQTPKLVEQFSQYVIFKILGRLKSSLSSGRCDL